MYIDWSVFWPLMGQVVLVGAAIGGVTACVLDYLLTRER